MRLSETKVIHRLAAGSAVILDESTAVEIVLVQHELDRLEHFLRNRPAVMF